jgi:phosphopantetheine adenylyltransferase
VKKFLLFLALLGGAVSTATANTNTVVTANAFTAQLKPYDEKIAALQERLTALRARRVKQKPDLKQIRELTGQVVETRRQRRLKAIELSLEAHGRSAAANRESRAETSVPVRVR